MSLHELVARRHVLLCVGSGGVGKTTTAAALAVAGARAGRRTAVVTVDPAQRLKDTLGLGAGDGGPHRVELGGGAAPLDALLLDVRRTFDELVGTLARDAAEAERILANRLYRNLSGTLTGTAEYMAVEAVYRLHRTGAYDLIVVDTPPARQAVDFLDAPRRLVSLLESRAFAVLKSPASILPAAGSRMAELVLRGVLYGLERFTGIALIREIGEFVTLVESLTDALRDRMLAVSHLLASSDTSLLLVTAPEARLARETMHLAHLLRARGLALAGVIVNRAVPQHLFGPAAPVLAPPRDVPPALQRRLRALEHDLRAVAAAQATTLAPILAEAGAPCLAEVPVMADPPTSLSDLDALAGRLLAGSGSRAA